MAGEGEFPASNLHATMRGLIHYLARGAFMFVRDANGDIGQKQAKIRIDFRGVFGRFDLCA